jgi:hypothetical protein
VVSCAAKITLPLRSRAQRDKALVSAKQIRTKLKFVQNICPHSPTIFFANVVQISINEHSRTLVEFARVVRVRVEFVKNIFNLDSSGLKLGLRLELVL